MVVLTTTPRILAAVATLPASTLSSLNLDLDSIPSTPGAPIEHATLLAISKATRSSLNSLLRGTKVYTPPPAPKPEHTPEYVALMARLRKEEERREYAQLVSRKPVDLIDGDTGDDEKDDISPSLVFNILLSIVLCAGTMFYLTRWWANDGLRVLASLSTGLLVGVAEVTVYAGYLRKVKQSRDKERSKRETKQFIGEYTGEPAEPIDHMASVDKQEIWGRGINGGMRRRVREKWEKERESEN
ncbi:uncharacterized protein PV06_10427 [Exophiala oligosperma]|uniref:Endoplasmic reticulum-based factor for assembly of V-ATPase-domain-containing protein n=2 Tax=Chaetothyriales TaxID=34395 RepID=A0A0D2D243_9EURO|nr:uncharacterized protein PV06_10427 [Exophiala oligosperma]KAJ9646825.1 hypothetical protein H2204_000517 [Knufia peltigerae]KIW37383.1 hypothetical protein PV06_10427 [Exophiala oligosperma]